MKGASANPESPRAPRVGIGWQWGLAGGYLALVLVSLAVRPIVGIGLAAAGALFVLFRQVDIDATAVLTVYIVALALIPPTYIVPSLGAGGTPAGIIALAAGYWWILERVAPRPGADRRTGLPERFHPLRAALAFYLLTAAMAFVVTFSRPTTAIERNGTARALIGVAGTVGVALLASDGLRSRVRFDVLLNRVLNLGVVMSIVGCIQYFTDFDPVANWKVPGLVSNWELESVVERSVVSRVASTTLHPIEFGAVLAMLLPLALHTAMYADPSVRVRRWIRVGIIALALPMSVSRTAVVIVAVVLIMLWPAWSWARRLRFMAVSLVFLFLVRAAVSGLLGTILALFTSFNEDPSTSGRTEDYGPIFELVAQRPIFGRGIGTFDPGLYFFLDNQLLMTLVTGGVFGLVGMLVLFVVAATLARQVFWHGPDEESRHLGACLAAAIVGGFVGFLTFDALGFPVFAGMLFVIIGLAGALWRLTVSRRGRRYTNPRAGSMARPDAPDERTDLRGGPVPL